MANGLKLMVKSMKNRLSPLEQFCLEYLELEYPTQTLTEKQLKKLVYLMANFMYERALESGVNAIEEFNKIKDKEIYPITQIFKDVLEQNHIFGTMTETQKTKTFEVFTQIEEEKRYLNLNIILELIKKEHQ